MEFDASATRIAVLATSKLLVAVSADARREINLGEKCLWKLAHADK